MPERSVLRMYGRASDHDPLPWEWVDGQLAAAGTYWVVAAGAARPHPRPVWGVWVEPRLYLSIGTPATVQALGREPAVAVHLDSGTDVVIVEGRVTGPADDPDVLAAYDRKYDWSYDVGTYGPLQRIEPDAVLAWRAAGWAGRDSFRQTGRWRLGDRP